MQEYNQSRFQLGFEDDKKTSKLNFNLKFMKKQTYFQLGFRDD